MSSVEAIVLALIVSVIAPVLLSQLQGRRDHAARATEAKIRADEKQADWDRQDEVADRVKEAAALLVKSNATVAGIAETVDIKLDRIHTLVNSNMTAQIQESLNSSIREVAALEEVVALKREQGAEPSVESLVAIESAKNKIVELQALLIDRRTQAALVASQHAERTTHD